MAGAFTASNAFDIHANVMEAEKVGRVIAEAGAMPLIPHANTRHFVGLCTPEFWYAGTLELLKRCDAVAMVRGWHLSKGAADERDEAKRLGIYVFEPDRNADFHDHDVLIRWIKAANQ